MSWRPVVHCEGCGHVHRLERRATVPAVFYMVCHGCEGVLRVEVTQQALTSALAKRAHA